MTVRQLSFSNCKVVICVNFVGVRNSSKTAFFFAHFLNCKTYSMEQSSSSKVNSSFTSQECTRILGNTKIQHLVHKSPSLVPILSQINSVHNLQSCFLKIQFNITFPIMPRLCKCSHPYRFSYQSRYAFLFSPIRTACPVHLALDWIILIIFRDLYEPWNSSLCNFLQPSVSSCLLGALSSSAPYSQTPSHYILPWMWQTEIHTYINQQAK
jgi:hypothetical protein